ncbi:DEAD-domain-containing protein [Perkinsela sp. CCAP 1560/4]|nr:DEAD-domain-containing protein [Perkinsela sp. CCAP 1560/4]KNH08553.1 DEAD-domain-containing protein [Perkinsela sp. CCAP 1560/4]|eukprot:KNH04022.1 DEAD-domain-containing protein [Perkinsela sp. CCAP 1560/4]
MSTKTAFTDITPPIHHFILQSLRDNFQYDHATAVQALVLPSLLAGVSAMVQAETGGGKTLAFLIPIVCRHLAQPPQSSTFALILTPTRELAIQIRGVLEGLTSKKLSKVTFTTLIGGTKRKAEVESLSRNPVVVVGTPGRVLDHMTSTKEWNYSKLAVFCIDEADRVLENGFEEQLNDMISRVPKTADSQVMLFSATNDATKLDDLNKITSSFPVKLQKFSTMHHAGDVVSTLQHGFVTVQPDEKFALLYMLLKQYLARELKVIVFLASCNEVRHFSDLLNYIDVPVVPLHGQMRQATRTTTFHQFCNSRNVILLTTDVAARGLDFPFVDWIIQYDPPDSVPKYVHRVGRTARAERDGNALVMLLPQETPMIQMLARNLTNPLKEFKVGEGKINKSIIEEVLKLVGNNRYLKQGAVDAFRSYLQSYAAQSLKAVFDVYSLDVAKVARAFGLSQAPIVDLGLSHSALRRDRSKRKWSSGQE